MTLNKAIELAIDNGYNYQAAIGYNDSPVLDVKFWKALGKGLNWIDVQYEQGVGPVFAGRPTAKIHRRDYRKKMEGLMTHLADGKSIDGYFKKLLK